MDAIELLDQPLVARVAVTGRHGPTVRPVWFLYEDGILWWLTGSYSRLGTLLGDGARAAAVVDTCDLRTGEVRAVTLTGEARVHPLDPDRARRKLRKYLGDDEAAWPERFRNVLDDPATRLISLTPDGPPRLRDLSFTPMSGS